MLSLPSLLATQRRLERRFRGFLSSLDGNRTATIREIIEQPRRALTRIKAQWCNVDMLVCRLTAMTRFFAELPDHVRMPRNSHLAFFQASPAIEDHTEYQRRCREYEFWRDTYEGFPPEAFYLHPRTNFLGHLQGTWRGKRVIRPLNHFASYGNLHWCEKPLIVGMRVPNYPAMLGVSSDVATDYFVRTIVHDFGHSFLPAIDRKREALHNVVMLYAIDCQSTSHLDDSWESIVHRECTDPYFVLDAPALLRACTAKPLTPSGAVLRRDMQRIYCSRRRGERLQELWSVGPEMSLDTARRCLLNIIHTLCRSGFEQYEA